jgi:hypothetical protein
MIKQILMLIGLLSLQAEAFETSKVIPQAIKALANYSEYKKPLMEKELRDINNNVDTQITLDQKLFSILKTSGLDQKYIRRILTRLSSQMGNGFVPPHYILAKNDAADKLIERQYYRQLAPSGNLYEARLLLSDPALPKLALHAYKMDVINKSEFLKDEIYFYFFTTDGLVPSANVTDIYKGVGSGESFFLKPSDRIVFPLDKSSASVPRQHLIVDYGIVESDGDDIEQMQKLSAIIIDLAAAILTVAAPEVGPIVLKLRKEVKHLAEVLLSLNTDDRLVTDTVSFSTSDLFAALPGEKSIHEFSKTYSGGSRFSKWKYKMNFRLLKAQAK